MQVEVKAHNVWKRGGEYISQCLHTGVTLTYRIAFRQLQLNGIFREGPFQDTVAFETGLYESFYPEIMSAS